MFYFTLAVLLVFAAAFVFLKSDPRAVAKLLRAIIPGSLILLAVGAVLTGRTGFAMLLATAGAALYGSMQRRAATKRPKGQSSSVRSAALEMTLDHDTGSLEGLVLAGNQEGRQLADLDESELFELYQELQADEESRRLLEAYLDGRLPGWRDGADADAGTGQGASASSGAMTKQEAYQILGLEEGASAAAIRKAHRSLMQRVHPDHGGSSFLAARINQAKDVLLSGH